MDNTSVTASAPVSAPFIPDSAPFTSAQRAWLNGFLAALFSAPRDAAPAPAPVTVKTKVCVLFGSESGNAEALAKRLAKAAIGKGYDAAARGLDKISPADLAKEKFLLLITSTFGDGEPPENAKEFHAALFAENAPRLEKLSFTICALGDTNYEKFCECGKEFDARLEALGAKRIFERADCNVDFEEAFQRWQDGIFGVLDALGSAGVPPAEVAQASSLRPGSDSKLEACATFSRKNP
ncbi:MAG: sulfite reductase flavoprotein alpha-component, partial [Chthoniobacter sp.]|nr:sulfite reductase flavoprotein alpha-component [Chthoniobacter sp.]